MAVDVLDIRRDFAALGMASEAPSDGVPGFNPYRRIVYALAASRNINTATASRLGDWRPALRTDIGSYASALLRQGYIFGNNYHTICPSTEANLATNLSDATLKASNKPTIAIAIKDGWPLGIIKGNGEKTCYGLGSDKQAGIVAGAFSSPTLPQAFRTRLNQGDQVLAFDISLLETPMIPTRLGAFMLFGAESWPHGPHNPGENQALGLSHDSIVMQAHHLLTTAAIVTDLGAMANV